MLSNLPTGSVWLLNIGGCIAISLGVSYASIRLPDRWLARDRGLLKLHRFEQDGSWYERRLAIACWKDRLPDGGSWMSRGFAKKKLKSRNPAYLRQFIRETRRGEFAHWAMLAFTPLFLLWNEGSGCLAVFLYSLFANAPCIAVQRYNRARLLRLMLRERRICYARVMTKVALEE